MKTYSQLFDIYNDYDGINNLKTINDSAGIAPVTVDVKIIRFLKQCKQDYYDTGQIVNIAMGPVLSIWHSYREAGLLDEANAKLPDMSELRIAARYMNIEDLIINETDNTVFLKNKGMSLDVGAVAKGYAISLAVKEAEAMGMTSALINMGGNIISIGQPLDGIRSRWGVGIQDPKLSPNSDSNILDVVYVNNMSVVTSGGYQRYYIVDGVIYHHIIDPSALTPARRYASVTVLHPDSALADVLSTALFISSESEGEKMLDKYNAEAIWVYTDGNARFTDGYKSVSKNYGKITAVN
jgi:thiamine biosynthesis lipoprotein